MQLDGKVALIFGAGGAGNMGQVIARRLAAEGAVPVVCGRNQAALDALVSEIGGSAKVCDITSKKDIEAAVSHASTSHGGCQIAVNAVGIGTNSPILETSEDEIDQLMNVQLKGTMLYLQAVGAFMAENGGGSIIQISSATATAPVEQFAGYIATKAAGEALVRCFANELGAAGVKVNAVSPGFTHTPMTEGAIQTPGVKDAFVSKYPLGRIGTSQDIADAVVWLAQDASFITGQVLQVNGGLTLRGNPSAAEIGASVAQAMQAQG